VLNETPALDAADTRRLTDMAHRLELSVCWANLDVLRHPSWSVYPDRTGRLRRALPVAWVQAPVEQFICNQANAALENFTGRRVRVYTRKEVRDTQQAVLAAMQPYWSVYS
jgi:hypothetical protein